MANPKLTVEIDADVSKMEKELSKANKLLAQHERNYAGVQKAISSNTQTARKLENQLTKLNNEFKSGTISEKQYARETDRLSQELREVNSSTSNYQRELRRLEKEMIRAKNATDNFNTSAGRTQTATRNTGKAIGGMAKTTRVNAVPAMTSFSQVVQDAPYGIQGVANNIQQLTMQMGYLSRSAGGTGSALKAMVSSLLGPAGILLAISALTTAFISYGDEILDFIKNTSDAEKAQRKLTEAMASGIAEARTSAIELSALTDEIKTNNGSLLTQRKAYNKLNEVAPELTEIYTLQEIAAGKADTAIKKLTDSILKQAQIEGAKTVITELNEEIFKLESSLGEGTASFSDYRDAVYDAIGALSSSEFKKALEMRGAATGKEEIAELDKQLEKFTKRYRELIGESVTPSQDQDFFNINSPEAREAALAQQKILDELAEKAKSGDPVRIPVTLEPVSNLQGDIGDPRIQASAAFQQELERELKLLKEQQSFLPEFSKGWDIYADKIKVVEDRLSGFGNTLAESGRMASEELAKLAGGDENPLDQFTKKLEQTKESTNIFANAIGQSISQMAGFLTEDLAKSSSAYDKFAALIINTGMQLVSQLAQQAVKNIAIKQAESTADAVKAGTGTAAAAGPAGAFLLPGLVAAMVGLVGSAFSSLPKFVDGGVVGGNSLYGDKILARVNSKEAIFNQDQQRSIWGQMNTPTMIGNGEPIEIVGETIIQGEDLRVIYQRNERNRGRQT